VGIGLLDQVGDIGAEGREPLRAEGRAIAGEAQQQLLQGLAEGGLAGLGGVGGEGDLDVVEAVGEDRRGGGWRYGWRWCR
jgi:hypothetical protein